MLHLLFQLIVVFAELFLVVYVICFLLAAFNAPWRAWPLYPFGPNLPGSLGSLILALTIVIVGRMYGYGFGLN